MGPRRVVRIDTILEHFLTAVLVLVLLVMPGAQSRSADNSDGAPSSRDVIAENAVDLVAQGRQISVLTRSVTSRFGEICYRTAPLGELFTHLKGGFYHDGRFPTLANVVDHYNTCMALGLTSAEKSDLVQYLLSLTFGMRQTH